MPAVQGSAPSATRRLRSTSHFVTGGVKEKRAIILRTADTRGRLRGRKATQVHVSGCGFWRPRSSDPLRQPPCGAAWQAARRLFTAADGRFQIGRRLPACPILRHQCCSPKTLTHPKTRAGRGAASVVVPVGHAWPTKQVFSAKPFEAGFFLQHLQVLRVTASERSKKVLWQPSMYR
jgi:hypothetical protein